MDTNYLLKGKIVPVKKNINTWNKGPVAKRDYNSFSYEDYMKIYLLFRLTNNKDKYGVLKRTGNLMQIKCEKERNDFNLKNCSAGVVIDTRVLIGSYNLEKRETYIV